MYTDFARLIFVLSYIHNMVLSCCRNCRKYYQYYFKYCIVLALNTQKIRANFQISILFDFAIFNWNSYNTIYTLVVLDSIFVNATTALVPPSPSIAACLAAIVGTHALSVLSNLAFLFDERYICTTFLIDFPSPILLIVILGCYFFSKQMSTQTKRFNHI